MIYDISGGTVVGGFTDNVDYFIIALDHNYIQLAATEADATASTPVPIPLTGAGAGTQRFVSSNLSGEVTGAGTVTTVNGSRTVTGVNTSFERFFKVGDVIKLVDPATTPGVVKSRTITAITDDTTSPRRYCS